DVQLPLERHQREVGVLLERDREAHDGARFPERRAGPLPLGRLETRPRGRRVPVAVTQGPPSGARGSFTAPGRVPAKAAERGRRTATLPVHPGWGAHGRAALTRDRRCERPPWWAMTAAYPS